MENIYQSIYDLLNDYAQIIFQDVEIDIIYNISEINDDVTSENGFVVTATAAVANEPIASLYIPYDFQNEGSAGCEVFNNVFFTTTKALSPVDTAFEEWKKQVISTSRHFTRAGLSD